MAARAPLLAHCPTTLLPHSAASQSTMSADSPDVTDAVDESSGLPTYVKVLLLIVIIVVVGITILDLLVIAGGL